MSALTAHLPRVVREQGACVGDSDPDAWSCLPGKGAPSPADAARSRRALAVCRELCPVRAECLRWALAVKDRYTILGAMTPSERVALRRTQKA